MNTSKPLTALLEAVQHELGVDAEGCSPESWRSASHALLRVLENWSNETARTVGRKMSHDFSDRLTSVGHGWADPSFMVGEVKLRPPDSFFVREDQPWRSPPKDSSGGPLHLGAALYGARSASRPDSHFPPHVVLQLHVGYEACAPFKWLIANWRRPLERMLLPLKLDVVLNGGENPAAKAFRGKDVVRKSELYLSDPGEDPVVTFEANLYGSTPEVDILRAFSAFLSVYDAIYSLLVPRCDPDRLYRHFVTLMPELPNLPFRGGFYDPGQTRKELIEDWNRRHPNDPIPLDAQFGPS